MNRTERDSVVARGAALHLWMGKRCSYHPSELPEGLSAPTNEEWGGVELFNFNESPPARYTAF